MAKKQYNLWGKLRSAMRDIWRYSPQHRTALQAVEYNRDMIAGSWFRCTLCKREWPIQMAALDHNPALGSFDSWETFADWSRRLFEGPVRVIDKICHKQVTSQQRRKRANT